MMMILWVFHTTIQRTPPLKHIYHSTLLLSLRYRLRLRGMGKTSPRPLEHETLSARPSAHGAKCVIMTLLRHPEERHGTRATRHRSVDKSLSPLLSCLVALHGGQARHRHEETGFTTSPGANIARRDACAMPCTPARPVRSPAFATNRASRVK